MLISFTVTSQESSWASFTYELGLDNSVTQQPRSIILHDIESASGYIQYQINVYNLLIQTGRMKARNIEHSNIVEHIRLLKVARMLLEQDTANINIETGKFTTKDPNSVHVLSEALDICNESGSKYVHTTLHYWITLIKLSKS